MTPSPGRGLTVALSAGGMKAPPTGASAFARDLNPESGRAGPLRARCTMATTCRTVLLRDHEARQREHRQRAADPEVGATHRTHRFMAARTIAWLVRGNRRVPYRGVAKNNAWAHHRVAALNLCRLLALGLDQPNGAWHLARASGPPADP